MLSALGFEVLNIEVTSLGITLDRHNLHACHCCTGRVSSVRRHRDKTDVPLVVPLLLSVVSLDDTEASKFTLCSRVGLQADAMHACNSGQVFADGFNKSLVSRCLFHRGE